MSFLFLLIVLYFSHKYFYRYSKFHLNPTLWSTVVRDTCPGRLTAARKYEIQLPETVEQHDLSVAEKTIGWKPRYGFLDFLKLKERDEKGIDV